MPEKFNFSNSRKPPKASLNITSLMDVLTIILIFLLVNYSDVVEDADLPSFIDLPKIQTSQSQDDQTKNQAIILALGMREIKINDELIQFSSFTKEKDSILEKTSQILTKIKEKEEKEGRTVGISLQATKEIEYETIDEILIAAAAAGITKFDFIALREQE